MGSILSEIKGSMTGFEKLTPELVEKLSCDGLTYDELKEAMQKSGLSLSFAIKAKQIIVRGYLKTHDTNSREIKSAK